MKSLFIILTLISSFAFSAVDPVEKFESEMKALKLAKTLDNDKLHRFFDAQWDYLMHEFPTYASYKGYPGQNDRWADMSLSRMKVRHSNLLKQQEFLKSLKRQSLNEQDKISYDLALKSIHNEIQLKKFNNDLIPISQMWGIHQDLPDAIFYAPKKELKDYEDRIARLKASPTLIDQNIVLLKEGVKKNITQVKFLMEQVPPQFNEVLKTNIEESPLYTPFLDMPKSISEKDRSRILAEAKSVITEYTYPALKKLKSYIVHDYIPKCRKSIAWESLPQGKDWYKFNVEKYTSTKMTPKEIHALGLKEVARIENEMKKVIAQVGFKGTIQEFNEHLKKDPKHYYQNPKDLIEGYRDIAKKIDGQLPKLFNTLPKLGYEIREMPMYKAPSAPTAYYQPGSPAVGRPGYFEANTYELKTRPKYEMEVLTVHEAVPGHHLQIALSQEMKDVPEFRKDGDFTVFVEGWGLYSEFLGDEMGLYKDPYSKYGALSFEMWRAVRLVVDTGMHSMGWSKDKAMKYFMDRVAKTKLGAENEIDRYISYAGQALAYKIGQLKFISLREKAQKTLGQKFDIKEFHDQVLKNGALPMDLVEKLFNEWLEAKTKEVSSKA